MNQEKVCCKSPSHCAFQLLYIAFIAAPIIAGLDKFFNILTNWSQYLSAPFDVFGNPATTMMVVGVIEIIAGIGVIFKPRIFAYIIAIWLAAIIANLIILGHFYDIALRDFGLLLAALALAKLSEKHGCCNSNCNTNCNTNTTSHTHTDHTTRTY